MKNNISLETNRDLLKIYTYYRLLLAGILLALSTSVSGQGLVGGTAPLLFVTVASLYTCVNLIILLALIHSDFTSTVQHTFIVIVTDIIALAFLMHSSGGIASGLGVLIIISVAAASIFLPNQLATFLAAIASTVVIAESYYSSAVLHSDMASVFKSGILGMLLFATSLIFQNLSKRIYTSNLIASQNAAAAARLEQLNHHIVQRMRTGIIVVSYDYHIKVMNESAAQLLNMPYETTTPLQKTLPDIVKTHLQNWKKDRYIKLSPLKAGETLPTFLVNFSQLDDSDISYTLIFLEETAHITQHAQQLKLASLGRLTASIAHEIRNPLGAISHAAQLMKESETLEDADRRLTDIIQNHCLRMNQVVENVLQLSRRTRSNPQIIILQEWLPSFIEDYIATVSDIPEITLDMPLAPLPIKIDPSQLSQVLTNLVDNGLRYSEINTGKPTILLQGRLNRQSETSYLDIIDEGLGISEDALPHLFEPFYTTEKTGTGLGLYICKELCEANQARLDYKFNSDDKSCFRINFVHPDRSIDNLQNMV